MKPHITRIYRRMVNPKYIALRTEGVRLSCDRNNVTHI